MTADKMSRGSSKIHSRKLNSMPQASIQFDKLFHENSNRPSAAKSAGTIGKWGVISCTSLRSSNFSSCRDIVSSKRMRLDYGSHNSQNSSQSKDPFSFDSDGDKMLTEQNPQIPKPKKFFKSRNVDLPGEDLRYYAGNKLSSSSYTTQVGKKYGKRNVSSRTQCDSVTSASANDGGSKKCYTSAGSLSSGGSAEQQTEAVNLSSPSKTTAPLREENKPPIVLRIFKGTSHLVSDVKGQSNVQLPSKPSSENQGLKLRSTRRRHLEVNEQWSSSLHDGKDGQMLVSITAPKKSNKIAKDKVPVQCSSTASSVLDSIGCDSEIKSASPENIVNENVSPDGSAENLCTDHEERDRSKDNEKSNTAVSFIMHDEKENISNEDVGEPVKDHAASAATMSYCAQGANSASGPDILLYSEPEQPHISSAVEHDDDEKLSQAEELLSSTYVDFRAATEKLSLEPKGSSKPVPHCIDFSNIVAKPASEAKEPYKLIHEVDFNTGVKLNSEENVSDSSKRDDFQSDKFLTEAKETCRTIFDNIEFNTASERLIGEQKDSCKTILDLFTDSEDSNSIAGQISTIASAQVEGEMESDPKYKGTEEEEDDDEQEEEEKETGVAENIDTSHVVTQESTTTEIECTKEQIPSYTSSEQTNSQATRKGSIFKSRSLLSDGSKKRLALYKHKWTDDGSGGSSQNPTQPSGDASALQDKGTTSSYSDPYEEFQTPKLVRVVTWPTSSAAIDEEAKAVTSLKCNRTAKEYFTVIRNVKKAHQIQESGEFQEFNDDVEYILDALQDNNPIGTRCLSAITLASKCMAPAFRMHVRAHGTVAKFFHALHDAAKDQSLALCTATVMFVLSQDRLNMDLDRNSLELMLNLLESDASHHNALEYCGMSSTQLHKNKKKVRELCAEIQSQGHAKHLNLDNITVGQLAMETLLSLTSHRAGEWFKEELRELGGLDHIVKTINDCCAQVDVYIVEWKQPLLDKLRKLDRCLRVLENVTNQNEENQLYLLKYENGILIDTLVKLYRKCDGEIILYPVSSIADKESPGAVIHELLLTILKVLINITHSFSNTSIGSSLVGGKPGMIDVNLHMLLQVPCCIPEEKKFDMLVLVLIFLINLVEYSTSNRKLLFEAKAPMDPDAIFHSGDDKTAVEALISLFYQHEELARVEEVKTDAILDGKNEPEPQSEMPKSTEEFIEETVAKLLQKAGRNMEHTLIASYLGLLIGYLIADNKEYELFVRECLPQKNFSVMISVLEKVYNFMNLTCATSSSRSITQTRRIINYLEQSDAAAAANSTTAIMEVVQ